MGLFVRCYVVRTRCSLGGFWCARPKASTATMVRSPRRRNCKIRELGNRRAIPAVSRNRIDSGRTGVIKIQPVLIEKFVCLFATRFRRIFSKPLSPCTHRPDLLGGRHATGRITAPHGVDTVGVRFLASCIIKLTRLSLSDAEVKSCKTWTRCLVDPNCRRASD